MIGVYLRGEIGDIILSFSEDTMKIVNRKGIPQTNNVMDTMGVYEFALGLFGL